MSDKCPLDTAPCLWDWFFYAHWWPEASLFIHICLKACDNAIHSVAQPWQWNMPDYDGACPSLLGADVINFRVARVSAGDQPLPCRLSFQGKKRCLQLLLSSPSCQAAFLVLKRLTRVWIPAAPYSTPTSMCRVTRYNGGWIAYTFNYSLEEENFCRCSLTWTGLKSHTSSIQ